MKKIYYLGIAMTMALASCSNEELVSSQGDSTLQVSMEMESVSRVGFDKDNDWAFYWDNGDKIWVNGGIMRNTDPDNQSTATFKGYGINTNDGYAVYPYDFAQGKVSGNSLTFNLPTEYNYNELDADFFETSQTVPMAAKVLNGKASFKHLGAIAAIKFNDWAENGDHVFTVTTSKKITGDFTVDLSQDVPEYKVTTDEQSSVNVRFTRDANSGTDPFVIYVPLPTGTYDINLSMVVGEEVYYTKEVLNKKVKRADIVWLEVGESTLIGDNNDYKSVYSVSDVTAEVLQTDKEKLTVEVTAEVTGNNTITLPETLGTEETTFAFSSVANNASITIENATNGSYSGKIVIEIPEEETIPTVTANVPDGEVYIKQGNVTTLVVASAENTTIIGATAKIGTMTVLKGNVRLEAGAKVNTIERDNTNTDAVTFVYFEGELPTTGSSDPKIVYMSADFIKVSDNEYQIKSAAGLKSFRDVVNGGEPFAGKTITLAADINLNNEEWTPIGSVTQEHGFMGNFDGNGYTIKNLQITSITPDADGYVYAGLFGLTEGTDANNENYIKNLTIENVNINLDGHIVAAAIAYPYYTSLENIKVKGDVTIKGGDYTSGVLAYTRRCVNAKNISIEGNEGSSIEGSSTVGGVISDIQMNGGLKANYSNFAASGLTIMGNKCVGGISGIISQQTLNGATVENVTIECKDARTGIVAGALGGESTITNITANGITGAINIIGGTYDDGKPVIAIGDVYEPAFDWREKDGNYEIASAKGMFWLANEVNVNKNAFSGKTVKLVADIDLADAAWTPIGQTGATTFNGVFDGQEHIISNLNVDSETQTGAHYSSGLFGWVETHTEGCGIIKNVKIDGANVKGHHNCGALVGYITEKYAIVENCHVANATIACTYANGDADGDKAGALIGNATSATTVKNCTAANSTVSGGRDSGQVIGAGRQANVTGCSATNVTVNANGTGTGANIRNEVIGRLL